MAVAPGKRNGEKTGGTQAPDHGRHSTILMAPTGTGACGRSWPAGACGPGLELVRALMRELGLVACQPRPWRPATTQQGQAGPIPDLVNRDFTAETPGAEDGRVG